MKKYAVLLVFVLKPLTGGFNPGWTFIVLRDLSFLSQAPYSAADQLTCQKAPIIGQKWTLLLYSSVLGSPRVPGSPSSLQHHLLKVTQQPCTEEELIQPTYRRKNGGKMNLFGGAGWWQQWQGILGLHWPFWVLIPRPASLLLAHTAHHTGREGRNKRSGWI